MAAKENKTISRTKGRGKREEPSKVLPPRAPGVSDEELLLSALGALSNNQVRVTTEGKGPMGVSVTEITYPKELVSAMRGMFTADRKYVFELHASGTVASTAGGVINTRVSWDSSVVSYAEWTALAALFDEVKAVKTHIDITSAFGPTSTAIITQLMIAPDRAAISGASPSFTTVQRLAESQPFHIYNMGHSGPGVFSKTHHVGPRPYATTTVPGGPAGIASGTLGQFSIASNIVTTPSINVLFWALRSTFAFRSRA